jgi:hypothetical protein
VHDQEVHWRTDGHQLDRADDIGMLRFEVADLNVIIKAAAAASPLYDDIVAARGLPNGTSVLPLSCFALTDEWTPERLAEGTRFRMYREAPAHALLDAGFELWPTAVSDENGPDPRNEVHFDLIVAAGTDLRLDELGIDQPKQTRANARERLASAFQRALDLLGDPLGLPG